MANTLKKMMKQHKKKKLAAERARLARLQGKPAGNHRMIMRPDYPGIKEMY